MELTAGLAVKGWSGASCFWSPSRCVCCRACWRSVWADGEDCASACGGLSGIVAGLRRVEVGTSDLLRMAALEGGRFGAGSFNIEDSSPSANLGSTLV